MSEFEILKWLVMGILSAATFLLKRTVDSYDDKIKNHDKEIAEIRRDYLHRDDFREFKTELRLMFDELKSDIKDIKHKV
jgi:hypothetical protein